MNMHLTERGKLAKPLDIYTNGVKKKIKILLCVLKLSKPECCSLIREAVRSATHYYTRDLQTRALQKTAISPVFYTFLISLNV